MQRSFRGLVMMKLEGQRVSQLKQETDVFKHLLGRQLKYNFTNFTYLGSR